MDISAKIPHWSDQGMPERPSAREVAVTFAVAFIGIAFLMAVLANGGSPWMVTSFGSTAVLVYALPKVRASSVRSVFLGHVLSAAASMAVVYLFVCSGFYGDWLWLVCSLCVSLSIAVMMVTRTTHPPAGATALSVALEAITDPTFILFPLVVGLLAMVAVAHAGNMIKTGRPQKKE